VRAVVQRVKSASVRVEGAGETASIGTGLLVYLGVEKGDTDRDAEQTAVKVAGLRIFPDEEGRMSLSVKEVGREVLAISQFTLLGDVRRGRRPSFDKAEAPDAARALYREFMERLASEGLCVKQGEFRATMEIESVNHGPVTILVDSRKVF